MSGDDPPVRLAVATERPVVLSHRQGVDHAARLADGRVTARTCSRTSRSWVSSERSPSWMSTRCCGEALSVSVYARPADPVCVGRFDSSHGTSSLSRDPSSGRAHELRREPPHGPRRSRDSIINHPFPGQCTSRRHDSALGAHPVPTAPTTTPRAAPTAMPIAIPAPSQTSRAMINPRPAPMTSVTEVVNLDETVRRLCLCGLWC